MVFLDHNFFPTQNLPKSAFGPWATALGMVKFGRNKFATQALLTQVIGSGRLIQKGSGLLTW